MKKILLCAAIAGLLVGCGGSSGDGSSSTSVEPVEKPAFNPKAADINVLKAFTSSGRFNKNTDEEVAALCTLDKVTCELILGFGGDDDKLKVYYINQNDINGISSIAYTLTGVMANDMNNLNTDVLLPELYYYNKAEDIMSVSNVKYIYEGTGYKEDVHSKLTSNVITSDGIEKVSFYYSTYNILPTVTGLNVQIDFKDSYGSSLIPNSLVSTHFGNEEFFKAIYAFETN